MTRVETPYVFIFDLCIRKRVFMSIRPTLLCDTCDTRRLMTIDDTISILVIGHPQTSSRSSESDPYNPFRVVPPF